MTNPRQTLRPRRHPVTLFWIACLFLLTSISAASTIVGKVTNASRHQPSSGDDVILYRVDQTMHEVDRTRSDARGAFRFETSRGARYLVAVSHQKVSYHTKVLSAAAPAEVSVYDAAAKLARVQETSNTLFPQVDGNVLRVTEFFVVSNQSNPPRTLSAKQTFEFLIPRGATLDSTAVQPPGTLPLLASASRCGPRDQYCIAYPIRPGMTKVRILYHLPFAGSISINAPQLDAVPEVALMVPDSLRFETKVREVFLDRGRQEGLSRYVATNMRPGQTITFSLSVTSRSHERESAAVGATPSQLPLAARPAKAAQLVPLSGRHYWSWTTLMGALSGAVSLIVMAFMRATRVPVQGS